MIYVDYEKNILDLGYVEIFVATDIHTIKAPSTPNRLLMVKWMGYVDYWMDVAKTYKPKVIVELGTFKGGSAMLLMELFQPDLFITIDRVSFNAEMLLRSAMKRSKLKTELRVIHGLDLADKQRLYDALWAIDPNLRVDMVVDDASNSYGPTRAAFEVLFPKLVPGGRYFVEDWAHNQWREHHLASSEPQFAWREDPSCFVTQCMLMSSKNYGRSVIQKITVHQIGVADIERSAKVIPDPLEFSLDDIRKVSWLSSPEIKK